MPSRLWIVFSILALIPLPHSRAADWLQWRGPQGTGQTDIKSAPLEWSQEKNVKWRVELDGQGNSSPIVVGQRVFITHAPAKSKARGLRCYDRSTGDLLWKHEIEYAEAEKTHGTNPYCASSPTSDGQRIMAWYGSPGLFCYDLEGQVLWQKELGKVEHIWGFASSPVFYENLVILNYGPGTNAFVAAFDKTTGDEVWRKEYPEQKSEKIGDYRGSWSTPIFYKEGDRTLMLLTLPKRLWSIDPKTGEEVWWCDGGARSELFYTSPIIAGDIAVAMCGYGGAAFAVRTGGQGDVTETHQVWRHPGNPQRVGSGVVVDDLIYILNEPGIAWCLDPKTGEKKWEQRVDGAKSWCSTTHVAGRLYTGTEAGTTIVWEPTTEGWKVLAENKLGELTRASPAYSDGQIFIRTYQALYCIEESK
jgi:outer membrane protein assembly factor BamB